MSRTMSSLRIWIGFVMTQAAYHDARHEAMRSMRGPVASDRPGEERQQAGAHPDDTGPEGRGQEQHEGEAGERGGAGSTGNAGGMRPDQPRESQLRPHATSQSYGSATV